MTDPRERVSRLEYAVTEVFGERCPDFDLSCATCQAWWQIDAALAAMEPAAGVRVKPLNWEYHPAGTIAAPSTGHAYIIDTRMKGRVHSIKGFNPQREFSSLDEAKAAAQADYERRIVSAIEPAAPTVQEAARVLNDHQLYYLRAIARRLDEFQEALDGIDALTIGGEALADERDWLDCFIDEQTRALAGSETGEAE